MDLKTTYMGMKLAHPLMPGASPICDNLDMVRKFEDAGASAIVMHSLFEEQITAEQLQMNEAMDSYSHAFPEAMSYFPEPEEFALGPEEYLDHVVKIKKAIDIPVFASLNGTTAGGWLGAASMIEQAGADGLELNVYQLPADISEDGGVIEDRTVEMVKDIRKQVKIPLAVKLSPFYTSLPNFAKRLSEAGAQSLVLFNRFYQPDIDIEELEVIRDLKLSTSAELNLRLRWLAILAGRVPATLACSGGVHQVEDVVKALMAGASAVQVVSALLRGGPDYIKILKNELVDWMEEHEYESMQKLQGNMSLFKCPDATAYERANYMHIIQGWRDPRHRFEKQPGNGNKPKAKQ